MREFLIDLHQEEYKVENLTTLSYEELSQWAVGEAVIKAAVNRWSALGFLDGITNKNKRDILAVAYDNIAYDLLTENERVIKIEKRYNFNCSPDGEDFERGSLAATFDFCVVVFPLLRRVVCGAVGKTDGATKFSYKKFLDYLEDFSFLAINYDGYNREMDVEAEFVAILALLIEERFDNEKNID
jgi:hypothetical protein